ncbi:hypothetical protein V493_08118 [Pseudogymnoascus sp. VKM F-4281 (FW-2241)]|nr:hypothetical protein V493_08118 [Pseudogymnoascus sp. VKM F-4281 (FW-2241)]
MTIIPSQGRKPAFILSHPRTASNLFMKIFKSHPEVFPTEYPFLNIFYYSTESQTGRKGPKTDATRNKFQEKAGVPRTYCEAFKKLEEDIRMADEQPSVIDSNIETPRPPRATPQLQLKDAECRKPAVIDADDTMSDRAALERLCDQLQLDPQHLSFEWQVAKTGLIPWLSSIQKSTCVDMSKLSKGVDTQQEFVKWEKEFGSQVAQKLLHFVELAMPDYEYLLAQRRE